MFSDQTTIKLSADNSLLHEEVDMLREQLIEAKLTVSSLQADLHRMEIKAEFESKRATAANQKKATSAKSKQSKSTTSDNKANYESQISDLCLEIATLTQENNDLKLTVDNTEKEFEDARQLFETEITAYRAEFERLADRSVQQTSSQHPDTENQSPSFVSKPTTLSQLPPIAEQTTETKADSVPASQRRTSQQDGLKPFAALGDRRKSSVSGREVQILQIKLLERENQLKNSQDNVEKLLEKLGVLERDLQNMRKENDGLMKLQEKSAALIGQASTCLQIKSEQNSQKEMDTNDMSYSQPRERVAENTSIVISEKNACTPEIITTPSATVAVVSESITETTDTVSESVDKTPTSNFWSAVGSLDAGEDIFGMPQERTQEEKRAESLQLVIKMIEQVNENQTDFAAADSKALKQVQTELQKICKLVTGFLEYSSNLINDEADVVSSAMDSLMSHLPDDEKPKLAGQTNTANKQKLTPGRQHQARLSIAEVKYAEREKFKERVVRFADQAVDVIKAGERALSTKINTQQKNLRTVLHAMEDHKRRQSQAFKFTPPDSNTLSRPLMLEAHAVSTHDISTKQSHLMNHEQKQQSEKRRALIERLRKYTRPQGDPTVYYANADPDTRAFPSFRGLGSTLFTSNIHHGQFNMSASTKTRAGFGQLPVQNSQNVSGRNRNSSFLQIDATHPQDNRGQDLIQHQEHPVRGNLGNSLTIGRSRKPKLHKPFHFHQPASVDPSTGVYSAPRTAPSGTSWKNKGTNRNLQARNGANNQRDEKLVQKGQENAVHKQDPISPPGGTLPDCNPTATFFDLLSHSSTVGRSSRTADDQAIKLPPLTNL